MASERILVVDDHKEFLEILSVQLRGFGWDVMLASSAGEAFETIKTVKPSVILLDLRMPVIDGLEAARFLKGHPDYHDIPILAFSACGLHRSHERSLEAGCDDYLSKPFSVSDLRKRVLRLIAAHPPRAAEPGIAESHKSF